MFFLKELPSRRILESYHRRFPAMSVDAVDDALHLLRRASLLMRELDAYFASHGLSQTRFLIMIVLDREVDRPGLFPSELAAALDISRPVVTHAVRAMQQEGLLASAAVEDDGRAKLLSLTSPGRSKLDTLLPGYYAVIGSFMYREPERAAGRQVAK